MDEVKYSCIKLDSLNKYSSDIAHPVGINLDDAHIELMFDKILNLDFPTNRDDVFKEVKEKILLYKKAKERRKTCKKIISKNEKKRS